MQVTFNVTTTDADSFRRSEAQLPRCSRGRRHSGSAISEFMPNGAQEHEFSRGALSDRDFARGAGRPGTAHRCRRAGLGSRRAQRALGRQPADLQRGLWREVARRSARGDRVFRGAARAALRFSLARSSRLQIPARRSSRSRRPIRRSARATGTQATFQLVKTYGSAFAPWTREIKKPVAGTVRVAVAGIEKIADTHFTVDTATGVVTFLPGHMPACGGCCDGRL